LGSFIIFNKLDLNFTDLLGDEAILVFYFDIQVHKLTFYHVYFKLII